MYTFTQSNKSLVTTQMSSVTVAWSSHIRYRCEYLILCSRGQEQRSLATLSEHLSVADSIHLVVQLEIRDTWLLDLNSQMWSAMVAFKIEWISRSKGITMKRNAHTYAVILFGCCDCRIRQPWWRYKDLIPITQKVHTGEPLLLALELFGI